MQENDGAICNGCGKNMLKAKGCTLDMVMYDGHFIKRSTEYWQDEGERCGDCGSLSGRVHHYGCDNERCPVCGGQFMGCECYGDEIELGRIK